MVAESPVKVLCEAFAPDLQRTARTGDDGKANADGPKGLTIVDRRLVERIGLFCN
jgi:hypothetical protein